MKAKAYQVAFIKSLIKTGRLRPVSPSVPALRPGQLVRAIHPKLIALFNEYGLVRRDLPSWQICLGTQPFYGSCPCAPNIIGEAVATNGKELLVINGAACDYWKQAWFINFASFQCWYNEYDSGRPMQGQLNQCLLPFNWWFQSHFHRWVKVKDAKPVGAVRFSREQLIAMFQ